MARIYLFILKLRDSMVKLFRLFLNVCKNWFKYRFRAVILKL